MLNIEIDGRPVELANGSTVMDGANKLGIYVPHFCYHRKLSIAANCRMCLVQVEKAPKPMPACATPATDGMKVWTQTELAKKAQQGVMEFLLINHPLDCPICDQGGECQLQDLAVGYGNSSSRYTEEKRVVIRKNLGPLVAAEEMTRCIQCTRCVRFGQEVAGVMELGLINRGEHAEIVAFVGRTVDSELSGNMIDLCPVGALTSKPFRFTARTWELSRRKSVSPHDALGSNLIVQVKNDRVMRVLPLDNEAINECWLSDRDRFSYEALNSAERLTEPMIRRASADGSSTWQAVDWHTALEHVVAGLTDVVQKNGGNALGALCAPHATTEELALTARLVRGLGSDNIDYRLRQSDFRGDGTGDGIAWLGMPIADIATLDRALVVGSFLRKDHPLLAARLRVAAQKGTQVASINPLDDDWLMPVAAKAVVPPSQMVRTLAEVTVAAAALRGVAVPAVLAGIEAGAAAQSIAQSLASGKKTAVLLGNLAEQHRDASQLFAVAQALAEVTGAQLGCLTESANSVGAELAGARPRADGLNAQAMLADPRRAYLILHAEPEFDCANPLAARAALEKADFVVVMSPFSHAASYADVLLPVSPFTETAGTFVNCEGRAQRFNGVVKPLGATRPAWKVLRVLGTLLGLPGFDFESIDDVRAWAVPDQAAIDAKLANRRSNAIAAPLAPSNGVERVADVPIYFSDAIVRRAPSLQLTADARAPRARMHSSLFEGLGLATGAQVKVKQGRGEAVLTAVVDARVPPGVVAVSAAHPSTCHLEGMTGAVTVERA